MSTFIVIQGRNKMENYQDFKWIHIAFENCEQVEVPAEDVDYMYVGNLKDNVTKPWSGENTLSFHKNADVFVIHFRNKDEYKRIFEHKDITQIHIYYTDNTEELGDLWFHVPWGDDQFYNDKQSTELESEYIKVNIE